MPQVRHVLRALVRRLREECDELPDDTEQAFDVVHDDLELLPLLRAVPPRVTSGAPISTSHRPQKCQLHSLWIIPFWWWWSQNEHRPPLVAQTQLMRAK